MGDRELLKLFALIGEGRGDQRAKQVLAELQWRGYLYDLERKDIVTCEQWNVRYRLTAPIDCAEQARRGGHYD